MKAAMLVAWILLVLVVKPTTSRPDSGDSCAIVVDSSGPAIKAATVGCPGQGEYECYLSGTTSGWCWIRSNCRFQGSSCCSGSVEARCDWCSEDCYVNADWDPGCEGYVECWCAGGGNLSFCCC